MYYHLMNMHHSHLHFLKMCTNFHYLIPICKQDSSTVRSLSSNPTIGGDIAYFEAVMAALSLLLCVLVPC